MKRSNLQYASNIGWAMLGWFAGVVFGIGAVGRMVYPPASGISFCFAGTVTIAMLAVGLFFLINEDDSQ